MKKSTSFYKVFSENIHRLILFYDFSKKSYSKTKKEFERIILKFEKTLKGEKVELTPEEKRQELISVELTKQQIGLLNKIMKETKRDYGKLLPFFRSQILIFSVALFEYYIKDVTEFLLLKNVNILKTKEKEISYEKILSFSSVDEIQKYLVEKESFALGYMSYEEIADYFLRKFQIDFHQSDLSKMDLVEIFLLRNILLHNKGIVNRTFLQKIKHRKYRLGKKIQINEKTMKQTLDLIKKQVTYIDSIVISKYKRN